MNNSIIFFTLLAFGTQFLQRDKYSSIRRTRIGIIVTAKVEDHLHTAGIRL